MPGDARDLPLSVIDAETEFVVYSGHLGLLAEVETAAEGMAFLGKHQKKHPKSDANVFQRGETAWHIVLEASK